MKKITKILLPIAGVAAAAAPMVVMTSCGEQPTIEKTLTQSGDIFEYHEESGKTLPAGKYKFTTSGNVQECVYFKFYDVNSKIIKMDEDFCKNIKIVFAPSALKQNLEFKKHFSLETDGYIKIISEGPTWIFKYNTMSFEFELKDNYANSINTIKFEK